MFKNILTIKNKKEEEFLRKPAKAVKNLAAPEIKALIKTMREIMISGKGVGLSANQLGENKKIFVAEFEGNFYALINPEIIKYSKEIETVEEGCLSVPGIVGLVPRAQKITVRAFNDRGKTLKIKAKDMLARIFQHETDHLNGILFIDKAVKLYQIKK